MRIPLLAPLAACACGVWAARLAAIDSNQALTAAAALAGLGVLGLRAPGWRAGLTALACAFGLAGVGVAGSADSVNVPAAEVSERMICALLIAGAKTSKVSPSKSLTEKLILGLAV